MSKKNNQLVLALLAYLFGSALLVFWFYHVNYQSRLHAFDQELRVAAQATAELLGDDYHANLIDQNSISDEREKFTTEQLNRLIEHLDIAYVYTLIQRDGVVYFVAGSLKEDEMAAGEEVYFTTYEDADKAVLNAFESGEVQYSEYEDRWGKFRSVFIPMTASDGTRYIAAADIPITQLQSLTTTSTVRAALAWLLLGLIILPLLLNYVRSIRRTARLEIHRLYRDPLTGLPNRYRLIEDLKNSQHPKIAVISFDKFHEVNAAYGIAVGDQVLQRFALRLQDLSHPQLEQHKVYRLHGDTFAFFVDQSIGYNDLKRILLKLMDDITNHFYIGDTEIKLALTIGAVTNVSDPLELAEMAFHEAAETNQPIVTYDNEVLLPEVYRKNLEEAAKLHLALDENRLVPFYMPILNISTGQIEKHECLARIIDENGEAVGLPDDFIPVAHRAKLYRQITRRILNKAIETIRQTGLRLTINISTTDINDPRTSQYLHRRIKATRTGHKLDIEILETEQITDYETTRHFLYQLKSLGCRIGIDDLGRDYSNYERLIKLPFDFIKIDRTIIEHVEEHPEAAKLTQELLSLAREYELETIAEYCSNKEILDIIIDLGFDFAQGVYIGKAEATPTPAAPVIRAKYA